MVRDAKKVEKHCSIPWQPRFPKCLYSKREKLTKNAEFSNTVGPFLIFFTEVNVIPACLACSQQVSVVNNV